jgi:excinuclease ABC subunit C
MQKQSEAIRNIAHQNARSRKHKENDAFYAPHHPAADSPRQPDTIRDVPAAFQFEHHIAFTPDDAAQILRTLPALPGVFALRGPRAADEPYLTRAADLRRRITRILAPPAQPSPDGIPTHSKRLNLSSRVATIAYTVTGSEFESTLTLYHAAASNFGLEQARRRLKLRTPYFLRFTAENAFPRVYSTNRLSKRALDTLYGPFPSRAAADRYCDAVLDLFKLRRCYEDLIPTPTHPGCVYQEMNKCLAPCNQAHAPAGAAAYSAEAAAVKRFFDTHGESRLAALTAEREQASAAMEFERAAALHAQWHKVKSAQSLADDLVQPIPRLRAIIVQKSTAAPPPSPLPPPSSNFLLSSPSDLLLSSRSDLLLSSRSEAQGSASPAPTTESTDPTAAIFLLQAGCIAGPKRLSTLGIRAVKEQTSVGSSLFAQPLMLQAIPLEEHSPPPTESGAPRLDSETWVLEATPPAALPLNPEARAAAVIAALEEKASAPTDLATLSDHLSLLRRWYYRPEKQRTGEIFFPRAEGSFPREESPSPPTPTTWPIRRILRGAARMVLGDPKPMAETQRDLAQRNPEDEAQKPTHTKILHQGRPDVEREVPVPAKKFRSRKTPPQPTPES